MSLDILLIFAVLAATILVLATGLLRMDVAALAALVVVSMLGLVSPARALAGFANPAVVTVGGMFVLSAGLSRTGVAGLVGRWILRMAGSGDARVIVTTALVSGVLSGFMNNVGVVAMMLPVVVTISRRRAIPPSKLLIPMVIGAQLGGFTTLIGTAPNLLASDALREAGFEPFGLLSFTPIGVPLLAAGTVLIALAAPALLPTREPRADGRPVDRTGLRREIELSERLFHLILPPQSLLDGKTLADSLIGSALGVHVLAIHRDRRTVRAPGPETVLKGGDRIVVQGRADFFLELRGRRHVTSGDEAASAEWLESEEVGLARARVARGSRFEGNSAAELDLRSEEGVWILALRRAEEFRRRTHFLDTPMRRDDEVLLQGPRDRLSELARSRDLTDFEPLDSASAVHEFDLESRLWSLRVTRDSLLTGRRLGETRLGDAIGFLVLAVGRRDERGELRVEAMPGPDVELRPGDDLLVKTRPEDMVVLRGLQRLEVDLDSEVDPEVLEGAKTGFAEAVLAPRSTLIGKTLRQVNFRGRFGLHAVAIVREGEVVRTNLRDEVMHFGDALLLYGSTRHRRALAREADLILLEAPDAEEPETRLASLALVLTGVALVPVLVGWVPVWLGVLVGGVLMVATGCLRPDEAYGAVDWPTLVLVAGMLSLGAALIDTGAADLVGTGLLETVGGLGPWVVMAALALATALAGQIIPSSAAIVLMAPIAITGAEQLGVAPHAFVMATAIAATSLVSPVAQPPLALVMGPAGYRAEDYLRLGLPMTLLVLVLTLLLAPLVFPF